MDSLMTNQEYVFLKESMRIRLEKVRNDISKALIQCGRREDSLTLIGVSKLFSAEHARAACELGLSVLGENRVAELLSKKKELEHLGVYPKWHLIGTLQTNKVRLIVGQTDLIHSVSSEELLLEIEKRSLAKDVQTSILLQVNVAQEKSKHGFAKEEIENAVILAEKHSHITLRGLMVMAPLQTSEHEALPIFQKTNELFLQLKTQVREPENWDVLSMGMSQDYIDAIQCGATHIRIGTAIFGHRSD